jgi:hypothetical protein
MKLWVPTGGHLAFEGPLSKELAEFIMMALATDGRMPRSVVEALVSLTAELRKT